MKKRYCINSIRDKYTGNIDIVTTIFEKMLADKPRGELKYKPFTECKKMDFVLRPGVNFANFFPTYEDGDYAFISSVIEADYDFDLVYNVSGNKQIEVYFNGEKIALQDAPGGELDAPIHLKKGTNRVIVKVVAEQGKMESLARALIPGLRRGTDDYVYNTRQCQDLDGFKGQEGLMFSRLYKKEETVPEISAEKIEWVFPEKPQQSEEKVFDFKKLCGDGRAAYVYTCTKGQFVLLHETPIQIFADKKLVYEGEKGRFSYEFKEETTLLIKAINDTAGWGFNIEKAEHVRLPFVESDACEDLAWLWIGPFGKMSEPIAYPYGPEVNLNFEEPYPSACGRMVYWKFYRENTYLWQYLQTTLYGQWAYPMMVGLNALREAANKLGRYDFYSYFMDGMALMCRHRDFGRYTVAQFGWSSYLPNAARLTHLDFIGTIGMNVAEYYLMSGDIYAKYMLTLLASAMNENIPRFADGTFHRVTTMWTDDMYMSLPFLVRLGIVLEEPKYFDEAFTQICGFYERLFMKEEKIYSHIYYPQEGVANNIPWGRGNGWVLLAISEVLLLLPEDYHGRERILEIFREFSEGVVAHRDKEHGIWHQVLNRPDSYLEASGSGMFITALARGVEHGWIGKEYVPDILAGWEALTDLCVDTEGNVYGVCMGSNCSKDVQYYMDLGTIVNDDHGMGIVLGAGIAVMNMLGE